MMPENDFRSESVRFSRIVMMLLTLSYALFSIVESMYAVMLLTAVALIFGVKNGITSKLLLLLRKIGFLKYFKVDARCRRSYVITRTMEIFEESMRLLMSSAVISLYYNGYIVASTSLAFMMSMFMVISSFFGFCMSGIFYVIFQRFFGKKHGIR